MNVKVYIFTILLMSYLASSSAKEVNTVSSMYFTDGANKVQEYAYDASGNMMRDLNKGISNITYNLLNLPGEITFTDGRKVKYIYIAEGAKVRTIEFCGYFIVTRDGEPVNAFPSTLSNILNKCKK